MLSWNSLNSGYQISLLIVFLATLQISHEIQAQKIEIPSIWNAINEEKIYHLKYEVHLLNQAQERLMIEEWASFEKHLFRLDLVGTDGTRATYLIHGTDEEIFRYRPYTCSRLDETSSELEILRKLFRGYKISDKLNAYGLGPLWLSASESGKRVADISDDEEHEFSYQYESFQVTMMDSKSSEGVSYGLRLFFEYIDNPFVDAIEWVMLDGTKSSSAASKTEVYARAKVINLDLNKFNEDIFWLPAGYGCQHRPDHDQPLSLPVERKLLDEASNSEIEMHVVASRPINERLHRWTSRKVIMKLLRGRIGAYEENDEDSGYRYHVIEMIESSSQLDGKKSHTKEVNSVINNKGGTQSVLYQLDLNSDKCQISRNSPSIPLGLDQPESAGSIEDGEEGKSSEIPLIHLEDLFGWFDDSEGYHLINTEIHNLGFSETTYEKRIANAQFGRQGSRSHLLSGPVSIVKKVTGDLFMPKGLSKLGSQVTSLTVSLFSEDESRLLFKQVVNLNALHPVDESQIQRQLDIGQCFEPEQKLRLTLKYPIENTELGPLQLYQVRDELADLFVESLALSTPMEPIQLSELDLSFDPFFIYISFTLLDIPLTQTFLKFEGRCLSYPEPSLIRNYVIQTSSTVEKCAQSCDRLHCHRFSYDRSNFRCHLELDSLTALEKASDTCDVYVNPGRHHTASQESNAPEAYREDRQGLRFRPHTLFRLLESYVGVLPDNHDNQAPKTHDIHKDDYEIRPLELILHKQTFSDGFVDSSWPLFWKLRPSSIEADSSGRHQLARNNQNSELLSLDALFEASRIEYDLLLEGWSYGGKAAGERSIEGATNYDDCARACENSNCRSFSYCSLESKCIITDGKINSEGKVKQIAHRASHCDLYTLDYISKFDQAHGPVGYPTRATKKIEQVVSERDCAALCLEEVEFSCQSFHYCKLVEAKDGKVDKNVSPRQCLLSQTPISHSRANEASQTRRSNRRIPKDDIESGKNKPECWLYSRSFLAQFDEFYDKSIVSKDAETVKISGLGADECARECINDRSIENCQAFDVCYKAGVGQICRFLTGTEGHANLENEKGCTSFVISDKSVFHWRNEGKLNPGEKADKPGLEEGQDKEDVVLDGSQDGASYHEIGFNLYHFMLGHNYHPAGFSSTSGGLFVKTIYLMLGFVVSVGCAYVYMNQEMFHEDNIKRLWS